MFTNILLAVDGSDISLRAARHGIELAKSLTAKVTITTVTLPWATYFARELAVVVPDIVVPQADYDRKRETAAAGLMHSVLHQAHWAGIKAKVVHRIDRQPHEAIINVAIREGCDLIVLGSHRDPGFSGGLPGSETMKVLTRTDIPVLVYRQN